MECSTVYSRFIIHVYALDRQIFCDFGEEFVVSDATGEPPVSMFISAVTSEEEGVVRSADMTRLNLETGDYVTFSEVQVRDEDTLV